MGEVQTRLSPMAKTFPVAIVPLLQFAKIVESVGQSSRSDIVCNTAGR